MKFILLVAFFTTFAAHAYSDCLACWEMRGVKVVTKNGDSLTGYVTWNDVWLSAPKREWGPSFPKCFIDMLIENKREKFPLYKYIHYLKKAEGLFIVRKSDVDTVKITDIKRISIKRGPSEGLRGASEVIVVSDSLVRLLDNKPYAHHMFESCGADIYLLSYNKQIDLDSLKKISASNAWGQKKYYEKCGVIVLEKGYD